MTTAIDETGSARPSLPWRARPGERSWPRLAHGAATVNGLAEPFAMTLPAISKHIEVPEHARLVRRGQRAQYRPCALDAAPLEQVSTWAEQYRPVREARFDRMDDYLTQLQARRKTSTDD